MTDAIRVDFFNAADEPVSSWAVTLDALDVTQLRLPQSAVTFKVQLHSLEPSHPPLRSGGHSLIRRTKPCTECNSMWSLYWSDNPRCSWSCERAWADREFPAGVPVLFGHSSLPSDVVEELREEAEMLAESDAELRRQDEFLAVVDGIENGPVQGSGGSLDIMGDSAGGVGDS